MRLRGMGVVARESVETFASFGSMSSGDLDSWCLDALAAEDVIDVLRRADGGYTIEERIGVNRPVLEVAARLARRLGWSDLERCVVASAALAGSLPMSRTDHRQALSVDGHHEGLHDQAFGHLRAIGMLAAAHSSSLREDVLYSPHVWGSAALDIAKFISTLPSPERTQLAGLTTATALRPGRPASELIADAGLLRAARKVGLVDGARVRGPGGEKVFAFPPDLDRRFGLERSDAAHQRKLFVAHMLNGHLYGSPQTGRIDDPVRLTKALIGKGRVGPATAIAREYPLLESAGIVRTTAASGGMRFLELVKPEVAEDSLQLLEQALSEEGTYAGPQSSIWMPGQFSFSGPEADRLGLQTDAGNAEVLDAAVLRLREDAARRRRGEDFS